MTIKLYSNPNLPQCFKDMLEDLFADMIREVKKYEHDSGYDYFSNDGDMYFGECPLCGGGNGHKHLGKDVWRYCEKHKTRWITECGDLLERENETDEEVTKFFMGGRYEVVEPIYSRLQLPESKADMIEDLKTVRVTEVHEIRLMGNRVEKRAWYNLHPLPESCELQVRFRNDLKSAEKTKLLKKVLNDLKREDELERRPIESLLTIGQ